MRTPTEVFVKNVLRRSVWLTLGLLMSSIPVLAQKRSTNSDPCKNNPNMTQAEMKECAGKDLRNAEAKLEKILNDLGVSKDSPEQKAWEAYRDAQLAVLYPSPDISNYGSVYPLCYATLKTRLTEGRIRDLKALTIPGEGDACKGYRSANAKHN
jgi:uncharacterized protein YecT (DUF1311 family)